MILKLSATTLALAILAGICADIAAQQMTWTVYLRHVGPIRFGMSLSEVQQILRDPDASLSASNPTDPDADKGCTYLVSDKIPDKLGLMLENRRIVRVDVNDRTVSQTASRVRVGDSEDRVKAMYPGRIRVEPHHYDPNGHYLIYTPADPADKEYELLFETDGNRVISFRAGLSRAVALVEGCS